MDLRCHFPAGNFLTMTIFFVEWRERKKKNRLATSKTPSRIPRVGCKMGEEISLEKYYFYGQFVLRIHVT